MSFFGKNLKKLRTVKKLSQQALADKIGLQRATLGAYEEERSEPKIETLIKIANEFSITIDHLLKKELTVNDLMNFNPDWDGLNTENRSLTPYSSIQLVPNELIDSYIKNINNVLFLKDLPTIQLPIKNETLRGFEVDKNYKNLGVPLTKNDWVFCSKTELDKIENSANYVVITADGITFSNQVLSDFNPTEILELWKIEHLLIIHLSKETIQTDLEQRVSVLEEKINKIISK